jgi:hypothetical protein
MECGSPAAAFEALQKDAPVVFRTVNAIPRKMYVTQIDA